MAILSMASLSGLTYPNPNPTLYGARSVLDRPANRSIKLAAASTANRCSPAGEFLRQLAVSSVFLVGIGFGSLWAFPHPASARIPPPRKLSLENGEKVFAHLLQIRTDTDKVGKTRI